MKLRLGLQIVSLVLLLALALMNACAAPVPTAVSTKPAAAPATIAAPPTTQSTTPTAVAKPAAATPTAAKTVVKRGGTIKMAGMFTYPTFDPQISSTDPGGFLLIFDPLINFLVVQENPPKTELRPELAESWKITDPKTAELKLRKGVKFHDGSEWNAEVAKWNLDRIRTHPKSATKANVASINSVDIVDPYTIRLNLKGPSAAIFANLSPAAGPQYMISKAAVDKAGEQEFERNPVGTGAFQFVRWVRDDFVETKRTGKYWMNGTDGQPLPYVDSVIDQFRPDASVMVLDLRAGSLDIAKEVEAKDVAGIKSTTNLQFIPHAVAQHGYFGFGFSANAPAFKDKNLRLALQYAIDRDSMAKSLTFGLGTPHYVRRWAPGLLGYEEGAFPKYEYSPDKVKQYLAAAGHADGIDVQMLVISRAVEIRMSEMAKAMLDKVNIRTSLEVMERVAWVDKMHSLDFQLASHRPAAYAEPDLIVRQETCGAAGNWFGWCNKEFDTCMEEGRSSYDEKQRAETYKKCIKIMVEDAYTGVSYRMPYNFVINKRLQGFRYGWEYPDLRETWIQQ